MSIKKIVLITGASSGMGKATAEFLAKNNFLVYAGTRHIKNLLDLKQANIVAIELDITNLKSVQKAIDFIHSKHSASIYL